MGDVGVCNNQPARTFSLAHTVAASPRVRVRIDTSHAVSVSSVTYGGVAMTCTDEGVPPARTAHHYEIHNPPAGTQIVSGDFLNDVLYSVRLFDDGWLNLP